MLLLLGMCGLPAFLMIDTVPQALTQWEGNEPDVRWSTFQILKYFDRIFFSTLLIYQREILYQVLKCVLVG